MKKIVTTIAATSIAFTGVAATNVSAEEYEIVKRDTLWDISQKYGTSVQMLMDLNGLNSSLIHPGQQITVQAKVEKKAEKKQSTADTDTYTVVAGDTLSEIAVGYNVTFGEIMEWNELSSTLIVPGQILKIHQVEKEQQALSESKSEQESLPEKSPVEEKGTNKESTTGTYTVVAGDTLSEIAYENNVTFRDIMAWNNLSSTLIFPGQALKINKTEEVEKEDKESSEPDAGIKSHPEENEVKEQEKEQEKGETSTTGIYTVVAGDTLGEIAYENNLTFEEIMAWNNLSSTIILPGQELTLTPSNKEENNEANEEQEVVEESTNETTDSEPEVEEQVPPVSEENKQENDSKDESQQVIEVEGSNEQSNDAEGVTMTVTATAYTAECDGCTGITATGIDLNADRNKKVIAVDPSVIPLGTKVYVEGYGTAIAGDVGGAIKGNKIDIHVPTKEEAYKWGVQTVTIKILD